MNTLAQKQKAFLACLENLDRQRAEEMTRQALSAGDDPEQLLTQMILPAMDSIAQKQRNKEIVVAQIFVMAKIIETCINMILIELPIKPRKLGTVVIGTPMGDYHGLGKKLVATFLRLADFEVMDLGLSVNRYDFVNMAIAFNAKVICVSALLLHTALGIRQIREELDSRQHRDIKLVVGGALFNFNPKLKDKYGADAMASNAMDAVRVVKHLMGVK
ncbi:MAG: cobalamin-dependent protein [candidate division KSB1 bacterium]|nr:cobalamin-dependent protein [candidate division KSB1 bacterium]MDZ7275809.1 cobalamin-dependent protein [candidate division KSB1 bacterium]MDZ7287560.1 cobalamin-dependent protein [candidate division KSB1 bacterium]MDZ7308036.1 cobalamin-dependent protein [candidate division KSB1 bacterium]MDZ7350538.1 cobalamin-dependent protein [candidate division KSB1 bacterium]